MAPPRITRPGAEEYLAYYGKYITLVPGDDAWPALEFQLDETLKLLRPLDEKAALHRYQPEKWSVKEVVGHITDVERVFGYRSLRFARADGTPLPGFDENAWVPVGAFDQRPLIELVEELRTTRAATLAMLRGFDADALGRGGAANDAHITVRAMAWIIAGHERHHRQLLRERYGLA